MGHTDIHITLDTYADVFSKMNAGAVSMLDTRMKEIVPKVLDNIDDQDMKHELPDDGYKVIDIPPEDVSE